MQASNSRPAVRHALFAGLVGLAVAFCHQAWGIVFDRGLTSDQYSHILLVLPVSLILLYMLRAQIFAQAGYSKFGAALLPLIFGAFVVAEHYWPPPSANDFVSLSLLFFVLWCLAGFLLCYGPRAFRTASFPLLFLVLMVPLPDGLLQRAITVLQNTSTEATVLFFSAARVPFTRHGTVIVLPRLSIEVARECSSIRSSLILFISSFVLAHLYLKRRWQKIALVLLAIPLSVIKNGLRIFTLSMLGMYVNPGFLSGNLHHHGGIVFFAIGFAILLAVIWLFRRLEPRQAASAGRE